MTRGEAPLAMPVPLGATTTVDCTDGVDGAVEGVEGVEGASVTEAA
jgi:hypothetical protein